MALPGKSFDFLLNQVRSYGGSLAGGTVTFYRPGSTILTSVYLDVNLTQPAANPYPLSADGNAELFGNGYYRVVVKNSGGVIVFNWDNVECIPADSANAPPATAGDGSVHFIEDCLSAEVSQTLTTDYHQYWTRTGDSNWDLVLTPPPGKKFYNTDEPITEFRLYADGETVGFLYDGTYYYPTSI